MLFDTIEHCLCFQLKAQQTERIQAMRVLQNRIEDLWTRLEVSDDERVAVDGQITDHTPTSMQIVSYRCLKMHIVQSSFYC